MRVQNYFLPTIQLSYYIYPRAHENYEEDKQSWTLEWFIKKLHDLGFTVINYIENKETDTQVAICLRDKVVYTVFRGSSTDFTTNPEEDDWDTNFDFQLKEFSVGAAHSGFWNDVCSVEEEIYETTLPLLKKDYRSIITGHSQGAGDAVCLGVKIIDNRYTLKHVITYGGPRTVDSELAELLMNNWPDVFHRVVNNNDLVTRVPPRLFGCKHLGKFHYFKGDGTYTSNISDWHYFLDRMRYKVDFGGEFGLDCLNDHKPSDYLYLVERMK